MVPYIYNDLIECPVLGKPNT